MRTTLLLLGTMLLLAGGFALYWAFQPPGAVNLPVAATQVSPKPIPERRGDSNYTVGGGKGAWLKQFDEQNRLTHQFRADEYDPQKEGFVRVMKPEVHFFLKGGQWIKVTGRTGDVYVAGLPETGAGGDLFASGGASGPQMPSRGRLQKVRIHFFETPDATEPMLDLDVNNAAFDNESFRIYTEGYTDADGKHIAADQVKVTVRGKYEFDGRGLTIRWNDRDQRLELMEVAHGEQLVVKDPDSMGKEMPGAKKPREAGTAGSPQVAAPDAAPPKTPAPATEQVAVVAPSPTTAPARVAKAAEAESTPYSIWFHDNVRVEQDGKQLAAADVIEVYHAMRDTQAKQPATAPAPAAGAAEQPAGATPPAAVTDGAPSLAPSSQPSPTTKPATRPTKPEGPIIVRWTGKLRIVPTVAGPPVELLPGQTAVQMRGSPVVITRDAAEIRCPSLTYRTADGGITLHNSKDFPSVTIAQFATAARAGTPDLTLFSEWVEYAAEEGVATLGGSSRAEFPADEAGEAGGGDTATAVWTREGVVHFAEADGETYVRDLQLGGDVDVQHPQVAIRSQQLTLAFAPPLPQDPSKKGEAEDRAAGAALGPAASRRQVVRKVTASQSVHCVLRDGAEQPRELFCEHLDLATATDPAGKLYPKVVNARGNVRATEAGQALTAQELDLILAPAAVTKEALAAAKAVTADAEKGSSLDTTSLDLVRMVARTDVKANLDDGSEVTGTSLVVTNANGKPTIGLSGKPARLLDGQGNVVTSTRIVIPRSNEAQALGPGSLRAAVPGMEGEPPQFMDVTWTKSALLNGNLKENQVDVTGDVHATLPDADGSVNTARSGRILLTMAPKPVDPAARPTQPKSRRGAGKTTEEKGKDAGPLASMKFDALEGKEVSQIILSGDAVVDSRLADADGSVLREMRVESSLLYYNVRAQRFVVPRPGRMLVRDHRPPGTPTEPPDAGAADGLGSQRGATAFQWAKQLDYDGLARRATIEESVAVTYQPDKEGDSPVRLHADRVVATFDEVAASKADDGKGAAAGALGKMPAAQVKAVTADGNVDVIRGDAELTAPRLTYNPRAHTIVASASPTTRAVFSRTGRRDSLSAQSFVWNTKTWDIKVVDAAANVSAGR